MYTESNVRSLNNRQRRLRSRAPQVEQLEDRLQPSALLFGDELVSNLAPDPALAASAETNGQIHIVPPIGPEYATNSTPPAVSISSAGDQTSGRTGVAQPAMPVNATQNAMPPLTQNALTLSAAPQHPAASRAVGIAVLQGRQLTPVQATVNLVSNVIGLSAAPTHPPVQQHFGPDASQNWATYVTGTATSATGFAVTQDSKGDIYVTGSTDETGTKMAFVAEYDSNGDRLFFTKFQAQDVFSFPGLVVNYNHSEGRGIALDANGNIYVTGQATNATTRSQDAFIMRFNSNGTVDPTYGVGYGSNGNVSGNGIVVTPDGTATIVGTGRFGTHSDIFLAQIGPDGSVPVLTNGQPYYIGLDPRSFSNSQGQQLYSSTFGNAITLSPDGSTVYISGTGTNPDGSTDILILSFSPGTPLNFNLSAVSSPGGLGAGIVVGPDGTVYQTGTTTIQVNGQPTTYAAAISWTADLTTTNYHVYDDSTPSITGTGIAVDPTGNVYVTGTASDILGNTRALVDLFDSTGAIGDTLVIADNGSGNEYGYGIIYSQDGTVYVIGSTTSSNLSTDGTSLNGQQDAFLANVGNFMT